MNYLSHLHEEKQHCNTMGEILCWEKPALVNLLHAHDHKKILYDIHTSALHVRGVSTLNFYENGMTARKCLLHRTFTSPTKPRISKRMYFHHTWKLFDCHVAYKNIQNVFLSKKILSLWHSAEFLHSKTAMTTCYVIVYKPSDLAIHVRGHIWRHPASCSARAIWIIICWCNVTCGTWKQPLQRLSPQIFLGFSVSVHLQPFMQTE